MVQNLLNADNVSYPVLVTIAASPLLTQNSTVNCDFSVGSSYTNFSFDIVVPIPMVINFFFNFSVFSKINLLDNILGKCNIH
jgi:hypothetical protein